MNIPQRFFNSLFIILLALPFGLTICGAVPKDIFLTENRTLTEKPKLKKLSLRQWPKKLDPWFQDQLAFRSHLVSLYLYLWEDCLQSPVKDFATGRDGERFPIFTSGPVLQNYLGLQPLSKEELIKFKLTHTGIYALLKTHGIQYLLVTIPDKTTLYPELLPFWAHWNKGQSHYTQLYNVLKELNIPWIDLLPIITAKKSVYKIYNKKFDTTHWNGYGLEIAYQAIGETLAQWNPVLTPKPKGVYYTILHVETECNKYIKESVPFMQLLQANNLQPDNSIPKESKTSSLWMEPQLIVNSNPLSSYNIWLSGDSYLLSTHQYISEKTWEGDISPLAYHSANYFKFHFSYLSSQFIYQHLHKKYHPDVIIESFVERSSAAFRTSDPLIRILGDIYLDTPGHILTPQNIQNLMCGMHTCFTYTPKIKNHTAFFTVTKYDPYLYLQPVTTDADGRAMLAVRMHIPVKTITKLYYAPAGTQAFDDQHAVAIELEQGEHLIHLSFIDEPHKKMDLRFHPGCHPGEYHLLPMPDDVQTFQSIHKKISKNSL